MKKFAKILTVALMATLALFLVSCSSYNKILKAFEKEGYTETEESSQLNEYVNDLLEEAQENGETDIKVNVHFLSKGLLNFVIVLEFNGTKDLYEFIDQSEELKETIKDAQNSDYVNGNCILIMPYPNNDVLQIFKNA